MDVDTGQVCRSVAHAGIDLGGGRWPALGPVGVVPAVAEEHPVPGRRGIAEPVEQFSEAADACEIEAGEREARGSEVHMRIDESGCYPGAAQVKCHPRIIGMQLCA